MLQKTGKNLISIASNLSAKKVTFQSLRYVLNKKTIFLSFPISDNDWYKSTKILPHKMY